MNCFIFDLDGVIVDTARYHFLAWKEIANDLNVEFNEVDNEKLKGVSRRKSLEILIGQSDFEISENEFEKLMDKKNLIYIDFVNQMDSSNILPGVKECINFLKESNCKIGLASASKNARLVLNQIGLTNVFDAISDGNEKVKPKPSPEIFQLTAQRLNSDPENCVVIEDAAAGIVASKNAKMTTIGLGKRSVLKGADFIFESFSEISTDFLSELICSGQK